MSPFYGTVEILRESSSFSIAANAGVHGLVPTSDSIALLCIGMLLLLHRTNGARLCPLLKVDGGFDRRIGRCSARHETVNEAPAIKP